MNIVYGAIAIILSFFISSYFSKKRRKKVAIFIQAFCLEVAVIVALGCIFRFFQLGFFSHSMTLKQDLLRILGFAIFLGILVGMRAANLARMDSIKK